MNFLFTEDELLPLSGLQHTVFCERQVALIHLEDAWAENPWTLEGNHLHRRADESGRRRELRGDLLITRGLAIQSFKMGLSGKADAVEFHRISSGDGDQIDGKPGTRLLGLQGFWTPYPVEYKRGRPKKHKADEVQLCAQGMCLEEMFGTSVEGGALFYGKNQRRMEVGFSAPLRKLTVQTAQRFHEIVQYRVTPLAEKSRKCEKCSLLELCMPRSKTRKVSASSYLQRAMRGY